MEDCLLEQRRDSGAFVCLTNHCGWHDLLRQRLGEAVRQVGGMLITDSRGIFHPLTRSESPKLRLRSVCTGEVASVIKEQCALPEWRIHCWSTLERCWLTV